MRKKILVLLKKNIDKHIKIFIEKIPQEVLKKSCVCISSDHGTASDENNEGPLNTKLVSGLFAERFLKIPLLIYLPGNKKKMKNNKSLTNCDRDFFTVIL